MSEEGFMPEDFAVLTFDRNVKSGQVLGGLLQRDGRNYDVDLGNIMMIE